MSKNIKDLDKYTEKGGSIKIKKEASELNSWYDLEEILHDAHKQSECTDKDNCSTEAQEKWKKITGRGRGFSCFIREVEQTIKQLGGKLYDERIKDKGNDDREREREREQNQCENCGKEPFSGQPGTQGLGWNWCTKCLQKWEQKMNDPEKTGNLRAYCSECNKLKVWSISYKGGKEDEWEDKNWAKRKDHGRMDWCSDECQNRWETKQNKNDKCADCQQEKDNLNTIQDQGKEIKICSDCKQKRDDKPKIPNKENEKKWGSDFGQLKPVQREGRIKTSNNWDEKRAKNYGRQKVCRYCPQTFDYDKSLKFLPAKTKVEQELANHEANCPKKNDQKEQQKLKQIWWEKKK